jgi:hypothetical protein
MKKIETYVVDKLVVNLSVITPELHKFSYGISRASA